MTAATTMGSLVADVLANYQETKGSAALRNAFQWASNASTSYGVALEENPVAAGAALIVGLATLVVLGPELATGAAVTSLAGTLVTASFGEISGVAAASISAALIGALAEQTGESLYNGVLAAENSIINSLGGTLTPQTVNSNSCIVTPLQAPTGSNLLLMVPGANDTIERYFMDFPYAVPGVSPNSLTISTNGNNALTLDQGAWSKVSYNGQQLVASLVSSTNQADGTLTVNAQSGQGTLTTTAGQTLFNIFGSTSFDVNNGSGSVTINLGGVPTGNLQSVIEGVTQRTDGSVTFTDTLGKTFSTYPVGQLTGGSIKVSGSEIDAYNSAGKIQNSTQELQLGVSNFGVLDKVYNSSGQYSFTRIFDP